MNPSSKRYLLGKKGSETMKPQTAEEKLARFKNNHTSEKLSPQPNNESRRLKVYRMKKPLLPPIHPSVSQKLSRRRTGKCVSNKNVSMILDNIRGISGHSWGNSASKISIN
mmetsp:Transcript_33201/g.38139  ORF Transcript_33201/g.38139 Transcript_33201/m.38139 type:complete len:111 (-) Transcript_33201:3-335(-)